MESRHFHFWKRTPFLQLLLPFIAGIYAQWHLQTDKLVWWCVLWLSVAALIAFFFLPIVRRYSYRFLSGLLSIFIFISMGALMVWYKDVRHSGNWIGHHYSSGDAVLVRIEEPPVGKPRSYKTAATALAVKSDTGLTETSGTLILYFKKDSAIALPAYGSRILFKQPLQEISNPGNPGGFDYRRYCLFQGITHQVFLDAGDYVILPGKDGTTTKTWLFALREKILTALRNNIHGEKELGLAEALLIGYKNDLEQSLVQAYTNTGIVHVIAISGLHLGLVYWLLSLLCKQFNRSKKINWLRPFIIISGLWLFSLLAGAQPSVLRSAVMFTCIVLGESLSRKGSVYNTMALSAFLLLCYNPYWLWDVGFQLSYAAVLSILIFMRPVYHLFYIKNKWLDYTWKLNAVTISAQVLAVPVSIYHFHQFPNYFLLTNFVAVPLSSIILLGEIFLCAIAFIPGIAAITGRVISWMIWLMNTFTEKISSFAYATWGGLQLSFPQLLLVILAIGCSAYWLFERSRMAFVISLFSLLAFSLYRAGSFMTAGHQQKIIVYNVPRKKAIDFIRGREYQFIGDSDLLVNGFSRNFHLEPSRILHRITPARGKSFQYDQYINYAGRHILLLDSTVSFAATQQRPVVDLLVLSRNPGIYLQKLAGSFAIRQVVADGSVPAWKVRYWKKDCDSLHIPFHDVSSNGAFVMTLR